MCRFYTDRYTDLEREGRYIHALVQENLDLFKADVTSETWQAYVDYVDEMVGTCASNSHE